MEQQHYNVQLLNVITFVNTSEIAMPLVEAKIVVEKLHPSTSKLVLEGNTLVQTRRNDILRVETLKGMMQTEVDRVNKALAYNAERADKDKAAPAVAPAGTPMPQPAQYLPQTTMPADVMLDPFAFQQLLQQLKTIATDTKRNAVQTPHLTHMEIHEKLLAMKVHK